MSVGVAGAGTMGAGIAQIACLGGFETLLYDPMPEGLAAGEERLRTALAKGAERGRWSAADAEDAGGRLRAVASMNALAGCELVIEAAPEDLDLKRELFARVAEACGPDAILATNTSSLSVTAIAAGIPHPDRVVGMHFFNPPALMALVEIVAGIESDPAAIELATDAGRQMGRTPIQAADEIGFLANRVVRPFTLEALRMLGDGVATHDEIDRVARVGGGFRMGPFEMMDLVGLDVGFSVARSFWEQSFGEPRWQPHPIQAKMVAAGRLGRKSGRGYYDYSAGPHRPGDPEGVEPVLDVTEWDGDTSLDLPVETQRAVLSRIVCQAINEAAFALQSQVGTADDIDTAMKLGFNWPRGPLEWAETIGYARVVGFLDALRETHGDRYRPAPILREMAAG